MNFVNPFDLSRLFKNKGDQSLARIADINTVKEYVDTATTPNKLEWIGKITQSGTNAPVVTSVLQNDYTEPIVWSRKGAGVFGIKCSQFTVNTELDLGHQSIFLNAQSDIFGFVRFNILAMYHRTWDQFLDGTDQDLLLNQFDFKTDGTGATIDNISEIIIKIVTYLQ